MFVVFVDIEGVEGSGVHWVVCVQQPAGSKRVGHGAGTGRDESVEDVWPLPQYYLRILL